MSKDYQEVNCPRTWTIWSLYMGLLPARDNTSLAVSSTLDYEEYKVFGPAHCMAYYLHMLQHSGGGASGQSSKAFGRPHHGG